MNENDLMLAIHALFEAIEKNRGCNAEDARNILSDLFDLVGEERELDEYCAQKKKALIDLDMDWAREEYEEYLLLALHEARVNCNYIPDQLRLESIEWLRKGGISQINGIPLPPPGKLPE